MIGAVTMTTIKNNIKQYIENREITDKRLQNVLFTILFHHIEELVFVMDFDDHNTFRYAFINEAAYKLTGLPDDCIGQTWYDYLPAEKAGLLQRYYERSRTTHESVSFIDAMDYNGHECFGETTISPVYDSKGDMVYLVGITHLSEHYMQENGMIIESEQIYRSLLDHNMDAIISLNRTGEILNCNPSTMSITGYQEKHLKDHSFFHYIHSNDYARIMNLFERALKGYAMEATDVFFLHRRGHHIQIQLKSVPIVVNRVIKGVYFIIRDLSEQFRNTEKINYMVLHDQLTGLLNRSALMKDLHDAILIAKKLNSNFSLIYIDLDRFKFMNDSFGHQSGDQLLKAISQRFLSIQGDHHSIYRQGGDEFVILLENTTREETVEFIDGIILILKEPFHINDQQYYVTASMGISMYPYDGLDTVTLMQKADNALFQVKKRGRAHYLFYSARMRNDQFQNPFIMDTSLRKAIEKKELAVHYQPQINLLTNETASFEALLRWNHSMLGSISPAEFIPVAEDTGLIIPIGEWVIDEVCRQINEWKGKGYTTKVAINLSPKQFQQPNIVETIQRYMDVYKIESSSLEIEITEGTIQDIKETNETLKEMKKLGLSISVDDFGTGYSSLSYLKQFPLNTLKIDRSFISELMTDSKDAAITRTIIHLGHSLGLEVIAEGVETKEQADFLLDIQCEKAQGFYFSRPIPATEAEEQFLKKKK